MALWTVNRMNQQNISQKAGKCLLGVDIGTASVKVVIIDADARVRGLKSAAYTLLKPEPGHMEIDADDLWRAFLACVRALLDAGTVEPGQIAGIGISCLCPGLTAFGKDGRVLFNPIIYSDRRSVSEAEEIKAAIGADDLFRITANTVMSGAISCTSMLWIKHHRPETYAQIHCFGHVNTLMAHRMTGHYAIDRSNASYTGLFDTAGTREWSAELSRRIGIDCTLLPPVLRSDEVVGGLSSKDLVGLGIAPGTPVVIGGGDTACASLAAGIVRNGDVCESVGTTNVLTICVDKPAFSRSFINRCHVVDGTWIYQGAMSHTGSSLVWFLEQFCPDLKDKAAQAGISPFALLDAEAEQSTAGAGGVVFLPYMQGERSPVWDSRARGVFFGMTLQSRRPDLVRAVLEGCGYGLRQLAGIAEQTTGQPIRSFVSMGGGARSTVWAQIKADITGRDIDILDMNDAAPVGAALLAGVGCGLFRDTAEAAGKVERAIRHRIRHRDEGKAAYDAGFRIYTELYPRLKDLF